MGQSPVGQDVKAFAAVLRALFAGRGMRRIEAFVELDDGEYVEVGRFDADAQFLEGRVVAADVVARYGRAEERVSTGILACLNTS